MKSASLDSKNTRVLSPPLFLTHENLIAHKKQADHGNGPQLHRVRGCGGPPMIVSVCLTAVATSPPSNSLPSNSLLSCGSYNAVKTCPRMYLSQYETK